MRHRISSAIGLSWVAVMRSTGPILMKISESKVSSRETAAAKARSRSSDGCLVGSRVTSCVLRVQRRWNGYKEEVQEVLDKLPDDASLDDIQYHIYVCQKIQEGLDAERQGKLISQQEAERRMARCLEK